MSKPRVSPGGTADHDPGGHPGILEKHFMAQRRLGLIRHLSQPQDSWPREELLTLMKKKTKLIQGTHCLRKTSTGNQGRPLWKGCF